MGSDRAGHKVTAEPFLLPTLRVIWSSSNGAAGNKWLINSPGIWSTQIQLVPFGSCAQPELIGRDLDLQALRDL